MIPHKSEKGMCRRKAGFWSLKLMWRDRKTESWHSVRAWAAHWLVICFSDSMWKMAQNYNTWGSVLVCTLHSENCFRLGLGEGWETLRGAHFSTAAILVAAYWNSGDQILLQLSGSKSTGWPCNVENNLPEKWQSYGQHSVWGKLLSTELRENMQDNQNNILWQCVTQKNWK